MTAPSMRAEELKRQGALAERQAVLDLLRRLRHRYEQQRSTLGPGTRRAWCGCRIELLSELATTLEERASGEPVLAPLPHSAAPPNKRSPSSCRECGRRPRRGEQWKNCTTCEAGEALPVCPGCTLVHEAEHASRGDVAPGPGSSDLDDLEDDDEAGPGELDRALGDFDRRVREIMSDTADGDTQPICATCGMGLDTTTGRCRRCHRDIPAGEARQ